MKTTNVEFTRDELCEVRSLITSEMLKASEILDEIGDSNDSLDRRLFSYWYDKYQVLKGFYDKLSVNFSLELYEVKHDKNF